MKAMLGLFLFLSLLSRTASTSLSSTIPEIIFVKDKVDLHFCNRKDDQKIDELSSPSKFHDRPSNSKPRLHNSKYYNKGYNEIDDKEYLSFEGGLSSSSSPASPYSSFSSSPSSTSSSTFSASSFEKEYKDQDQNSTIGGGGGGSTNPILANKQKLPILSFQGGSFSGENFPPLKNSLFQGVVGLGQGTRNEMKTNEGSKSREDVKEEEEEEEDERDLISLQWKSSPSAYKNKRKLYSSNDDLPGSDRHLNHVTYHHHSYTNNYNTTPNDVLLQTESKTSRTFDEESYEKNNEEFDEEFKEGEDQETEKENYVEHNQIRHRDDNSILWREIGLSSPRSSRSSKASIQLGPLRFKLPRKVGRRIKNSLSVAHHIFTNNYRENDVMKDHHVDKEVDPNIFLHGSKGGQDVNISVKKFQNTRISQGNNNNNNKNNDNDDNHNIENSHVEVDDTNTYTDNKKNILQTIGEAIVTSSSGVSLNTRTKKDFSVKSVYHKNINSLQLGRWNTSRRQKKKQNIKITVPHTHAGQEMLYIESKVNNHHLHACIDTGASHSVISLEAAIKCGLSKYMDNSVHGKVKGAGFANIVGVINKAKIKIGPSSSLEVETRLMVIDSVYPSFIIGLDVMRRCRVDIHFSKNKLLFYDADDDSQEGGERIVEVPFIHKGNMRNRKTLREAKQKSKPIEHKKFSTCHHKNKNSNPFLYPKRATNMTMPSQQTDDYPEGLNNRNTKNNDIIVDSVEKNEIDEEEDNWGTGDDNKNEDEDESEDSDFDEEEDQGKGKTGGGTGTAEVSLAGI